MYFLKAISAISSFIYAFTSPTTSAEGARYESQGQVATLSGRRPWIMQREKERRALKRAKYYRLYFGPSGLALDFYC